VWLTLDDLEAEPEIPEQYHFLLATYAASKCLTQPLVDSANKADGRALMIEFDLGCREARQDRQRREMTNGAWDFSSATARL
jgi:hypothetical protein